MSDFSFYSENELLGKVAEGEEAAFEELVVRYSGLLYTFIYKHAKDHELTQEIVQDVFVQIWQARESLSGVRKFGSFLYVISRNHAVNAIKRLILIRRREADWKTDEPYDDAFVDDARERQLTLIEEAIEHLPAQQQKVWVMSRREGKKYKEIAAELNLSKETVKKYLQLANEFILQYVTDRVWMGLLILFEINM